MIRILGLGKRGYAFGLGAIVLFLVRINAETSTEAVAVVEQLFQQATKPPLPYLKIRALVEESEKPWTEKQIDKAVEESLAYSRENFPAEAIARQREFTRKLIAQQHGGKRWVVVQETMIPGAIRFESRDFSDRKPSLEEANGDESTLFQQYQVQNYSNPELGYRFLKVTTHPNVEVVVDRSDQPVRIAGWNLFQARHLEPQAALFLGLALFDNSDPERNKVLQEGYGPGFQELLGPLPFSSQKANQLLSGLANDIRAKVSIEGNRRQLRVDSGGAGMKVSSTWTMDQTLPYLVTAFEAESGGNGSYGSYRIGQFEHDFPKEWQVVKKELNQDPVSRKITFLSVSTNLNKTSLFSTNNLPVGRIWERLGDGTMRPISGITNWDGQQSPLAKPPPAPKNWFLQRAVIVAAILVQGCLIGWYFKRKRAAI